MNTRRLPHNDDVSASLCARFVAYALDPNCSETIEELEEEYGKPLSKIMWDIANHMWRCEPCGEYLACVDEELAGTGHLTRDCPRMTDDMRERLKSPFADREPDTSTRRVYRVEEEGNG